MDFVHKNKDQKETTPWSIILHSLFGVGISLVITVVVIAIFSAIAISFGDMSAYYKIFATIALITGGFLSGFISAKKHRSAAIPIGVASGVIFILSVLLVSLFIKGSPENFLASLFTYAAALILSILGGIIGTKKSNGSKKPRKTRFKKFK